MADDYSLCIWEGNLFGVVPDRTLSTSDWTDGMLLDPAIWIKLPKEVLEREILPKVPDSSKCRFRVVSKSWRKLLSSPEAFKKSASDDPRLLCKLYWPRRPKLFEDPELGPHSESWEPFIGITFELREKDLERASRAISERCSAVNKDCDTGLSAAGWDIPPVKWWESQDDRMILRDGLLCSVPTTDFFNPRASDVHLVNPMNGTWKLLPKCDGPSIPNIQLKHFQWTVVSEPLGCAFQFFVVGQETDEVGSAQHVLRYSSDNNSWDAFTATGVDFGMVRHPYERKLGIGRLFVLWNHFFCIANSNAEVVYVVSPANADGVLSLMHVFPYPDCIPPEFAGLACYNQELYFVGQKRVHNKSFPTDGELFLVVWKLDLQVAEGSCNWVPISASPKQVLKDFRRVFPGEIVQAYLQDFTVTGGMIVFTVRLSVEWNWTEEELGYMWEDTDDQNESCVNDYPCQYVYFRFADNSWFSGSRFFCSKALREHDACFGKTHLDNPHHVFQPRLCIHLGP